MDERTDDLDGAVLDGYAIEELADYLDAGREPVDPVIESSAACRHALAALERLRAVAGGLLDDDRGDEEEEDDGWVAGVLGRIALDAHAGADVPLGGDDPEVRLVITEGAIRALVRAVGDDLPGVLVGRVRLSGDPTGPGDPLTVGVHVSVLHGVRIPPAVDELRRRVGEAVQRHTGFLRVAVDVAVDDLEVRTPAAAAGAS